MVNIASTLLVGSLLVGQAGVPKDARDAMEKVVGKWAGEWTTGDGAGRNKLSTKWAPSESCIISDLRVKGEVKGQSLNVRGTIVVGWEPNAEQLVETNYSSGGGVVVLRWTIKSPTLWEGTSKWTEPDGTVSNGKCRLEFEGANAFTLTDYDRASDDSKFPTLVIKYVRDDG